MDESKLSPELRERVRAIIEELRKIDDTFDEGAWQSPQHEAARDVCRVILDQIEVDAHYGCPLCCS